MTYSGVGRVVPSIVAASTNASSQNAARRRVACLLSSAASAWPNQSSQDELDFRPGANGVTVVTDRSRWGPMVVGFMEGSKSLLVSIRWHQPPARRGEPASHGRVICGWRRE